MVEGCWYIGVYQHGRENCNNTKWDGRVFNSATDEKITGSNSKDIFRKWTRETTDIEWRISENVLGCEKSRRMFGTYYSIL